MLPHESNPPNFNVPSGYTIDMTNLLVIEENQVDQVIFNHLDAQGTLLNVGTLLSTHFLGIGMAQNIPIQGSGAYSGIEYEGIELLTFNFGSEDAGLYVNDTSESIHILNMGSGNDNLTIRALSGPMLINGEEGTDTVHVSSDEQKLNEIMALLAFDGGDGTEDDALILDNSADTLVDDVLNVTRLLVEVESMQISPSVTPPGNETKNPILPRESYLITLRNSTGGNFTLSFPSLNLTTPPIDYPTTAKNIENEMESVLTPHPKTCGIENTSQCSSAVRVWQLGNSDTFAIFFVGEMLNADIGLSLNTDNLLHFDSETFLNQTNDILSKNSDVAYTNVEQLSILMGHQTIVSNIRGTSAKETHIVTQEGDDKFFVASDANEDVSTATDTTVLYGLLDYIEGDLYIQSDSGRHRLLMSDSFSTIPKGVGSGGFAVLSNSSLTNLGDGLGDVFYTTSGNWLDDVTLWMGTAADKLDVVSIPTIGPPSRTTTSVHCGRGEDVVHVNLDAEENAGGMFVVNGQDGDDVIDASNSSLSVIVFGDGVSSYLWEENSSVLPPPARVLTLRSSHCSPYLTNLHTFHLLTSTLLLKSQGNDVLTGGSAADVLIGDYGRVHWINDSNATVAIVGLGGYGDLTDDVERSIHSIIAVYPSVEVNYYDSGNDRISGGEERDVIVGGSGSGEF